jgi:hypothetical protein
VNFVKEAARDVNVVLDVDVCVLGGSCTGVFAAVRAARLGAKVAIVEKQNSFGGMATAGLVNIWHSIFDTEFKEQIIGGLTVEVMESMKARGAVAIDEANASAYYRFNSEELKVELDKLVLEHNITPLLNTFVCNVSIDDDNNIEAVFVENKSGRQAVKAKVFVDATGDGDVAKIAGFPMRDSIHPLPPTTCAKIQGINKIDELNIGAFINEHGNEVGLRKDTGWHGVIPTSEDVRMYAMTHVFDMVATDGLSLSKAEMEGRIQIQSYMDLVRKYYPDYPISLLTLASSIGLRDSRRSIANYSLTDDDVLWGKQFDDAIANGSYRVDVHNEENGGFEFKYLDGTTHIISSEGSTKGRWRDPIDKDPTFYQIPYRTMVRDDFGNLIVAGRAICVDDLAFGAVRVMVNLNQVGEAAGVAAVLACQEGKDVSKIDVRNLRKTLAKGGSIVVN